MGPGWDRRTIGGTRIGQEDYRWDRGTRDGNSETRGGTEGTGVGQRDQEWDRGTRSGKKGPGVGQWAYRWDWRTRGGTVLL